MRSLRSISLEKDLILIAATVTHDLDKRLARWVDIPRQAYVVADGYVMGIGFEQRLAAGALPIGWLLVLRREHLGMEIHYEVHWYLQSRLSA